MHRKNFIRITLLGLLAACSKTGLSSEILEGESPQESFEAKIKQVIKTYLDAEKAAVIKSGKDKIVHLIPNNGVIKGGTNSERESRFSTYNQALLVFVYTHLGQLEDAKAILRYFANEISDTARAHIYFSDKYKSSSPDTNKDLFLGFFGTNNLNNDSGGARPAGANAWLLMSIEYYNTAAINPYEFNDLKDKLTDLLSFLQSEDGGIRKGFVGSNADNVYLISNQITENNISAYFAVFGYSSGFHGGMLGWLGEDRWCSKRNTLVASDTDLPEIYNSVIPTDLFSWPAYIHPDFQQKIFSSLNEIEKCNSTQKAPYFGVDASFTGLDFDGKPSIDTISYEMTIMTIMALKAVNPEASDFYYKELKTVLNKLLEDPESYKGLPYVTNFKKDNKMGFGGWNNDSNSYEGEMIEGDSLDMRVSVTSMMWLYFLVTDFHPLQWAAEKKGVIPEKDRFWDF